MAQIAEILPVPVSHNKGEMSISNSLAEHGLNMYPGSKITLVPIKTVSGRYLTGTDPDADYIKRIRVKEDREKEIQIVTDRRDRLQLATGVDLNPLPKKTLKEDETDLNYYAGVYGSNCGTMYVATPVKLMDGRNQFNFNDPFQELAYWWVIQYDYLIAKSLLAWKAGNAGSRIKFYISDATAEAEAIFKDKQAANKSIKTLEGMDQATRIKVARLLGIPVRDTDKEYVVYNLLDTFIKSKGELKGEYAGQDPIQLFNNIAGLSKAILTTKDTVRQAIKLRIYSSVKGAIYEGQSLVGLTEDEVVKSLLTPTNQQDYLALEAKINDKIKLKELI